jgi:hypothetical protein
MVGIGRLPRLALVVVAASLLPGCASSITSGSPTAGGKRPLPMHPPGPAKTALAYEQALFSGRFEAAIALVIPSARNAIRVSLLDLSAESVHATGLFAATTTARGHVAAVTLEGVVCTTSSRLSFIGPPAHPRRGSCVANHSLHASDPLFVVRLVRTRRGRWLVRPTG